MRFGKARQTMHQPIRREIRRSADRESASTSPLHRWLGAGGDAVERLPDHHEVLAPSLGDFQTLARAAEQLETKFGFSAFTGWLNAARAR
jgi:hypothetical protein